MTAPTILLAGGGTGGHVFPALAVAETLQALADVEVVFCGGRRGLEARVVGERGFRVELFDVEPMMGGGPVRAARGAVLAARETAKALAFVKREQPRAVLSVGGYASGPVALAGALLGVPLALLEPNSVVGRANRAMAPWAKRAYVAWDDATARFRKDARRTLGVPLRSGFSPRPYVAHGSARVLVMGGSQGAAALNERLPEALARVGHRVRELEVIHQSGRGREVAVRAAYDRENVEHVTVVPFVDDVAGAIAGADVVVARAGAVTLAEITAIGRASILVPFPSAADDHQTRNADGLVRAGAAVSLRQGAADSVRLAVEIERLLLDGTERVRMADAARAFGRPNAARDVAEDLLSLAGVPRRAAPDRTATNGAHAPGARGRGLFGGQA